MDNNLETSHPSASSNPPAALLHGEPVTHSFPLADKHGRTLATLNVTCLERPDLGNKHLPYLLEGEILTGSLDLDLPEETTVKSVKVSLIGEQPTNLDLEASEFVKVTQVLWPAEGSDGASSHSSVSDVAHHKLKGSFHWPFSLTLPTTAEFMLENGTKQTRRLPSSSHASDPKVHVNYRIEAKIHHGTLLHFTDHLIDSTIIYFAGQSQ
ncbi:uncharacterized protein PHACADRAFT_144870 [Phanerochaete carnosa HHB-10118-sp]|uniref:Arrestin-like N-terminal domain-containing protein n=1 Tax=Phanerochaete carnosa (strain HHB-10118-sp) TaxID=650164 RepID=K5V0E6_PHACS|nr:uncharacterized protein PHACADRAFT_144870 [Phanerochaete carnosa HHB-10118-sp]EKM55931.1 hypothetical protein PHACADRAFT_144870 [Phanerochaete carnosa HHB-10118-sp]